jgi:hypothetical protein
MRLPILVILLSLSLNGCATIGDWHYGIVNIGRARVAWKKTHRGVSCSRDYRAGWRCGYFDVSTGADGTPPPVPPKKYWSTVYQNKLGEHAVQDWYCGYNAGAIAAVNDGTPSWHPIPTSSTFAAAHVVPCDEECLLPVGPGDMWSSPDVDPSGQVPAETSPSPEKAGHDRTSSEEPTPLGQHPSARAQSSPSDREAARRDADFFRACRLPPPDAEGPKATFSDGPTQSASPLSLVAGRASE